MKERVSNLIAIAHPNFRADLRKEAEKYMLW
jgi:acyl-CoA hydrolase